MSIEIKNWNNQRFTSENKRIVVPFINKPIIFIKPMQHQMTEYEKEPYNFWYENKPIFHLHGPIPTNPEFRHQHFLNEEFDHFALGNFITDPPYTGFNLKNERENEDNNLNQQLIVAMPPSATPPKEELSLLPSGTQITPFFDVSVSNDNDKIIDKPFNKLNSKAKLFSSQKGKFPSENVKVIDVYDNQNKINYLKNKSKISSNLPSLTLTERINQGINLSPTFEDDNDILTNKQQINNTKKIKLQQLQNLINNEERQQNNNQQTSQHSSFYSNMFYKTNDIIDVYQQFLCFTNKHQCCKCCC
ncbi:hypothetical protein Mgra_00004823 [Meloidogyne graminicola]|uniref:Uncharacterized protein n=1 Tax=Meloidogyne graminicola TaxID=189291 RepID=A0A8S9ZQM3_9BILA|nr:hypothetical protein Mgra_00004823 [Meloidogyne graminicola]